MLPAKPKVTPYPHQREGIAHLEKYPHTLIADDMGLGKTIQALGCLYRNPERLPAVIVCPSAVKYHWESEASHLFGFTVGVCEGESPPDMKNGSVQTPPPQITIINTDILMPKRRKASTKRRVVRKSWVSYIREFVKPKTLIVDECQIMADPKSSRTQAITALAKSLPYLILMSGTPIQNNPSDLYPIVNLLWPTAFPSFHTYAVRYCNPKLTRFGWDYTGHSNLDELHEKLTNLGMLRRTEAILKLPEKRIAVTTIPMKSEKTYKAAEKDFMGWLKKHAAHKVRRVKSNQALSKVGYMLRLCAQLKMRNAVLWINHWLETNPDKKMVVFAYHTPVIQFLEENIETDKVVISGAITGRLRQASIHQFQKSPGTRCCIGQLKAASTGITLTAATMLCFVELWHNPATMDQAIKRIHRIGQKHAVDIHYLVARGSIEERVCRALQEKKHVASSVIDGQADQSFNLFEELAISLQKETFK